MKKKNPHETTSWYLFIRHSTKQMKGWNNDGTYHLCSHTQCKGNNQSPLFRAWPIEGVLSQHQSREDIQALLTVLSIRNHPFLDDKKTQKFREKLPKPKGNSLLLLPNPCGLVINWVFLQICFVNRVNWIQIHLLWQFSDITCLYSWNMCSQHEHRLSHTNGSFYLPTFAFKHIFW